MNSTHAVEIFKTWTDIESPCSTLRKGFREITHRPSLVGIDLDSTLLRTDHSLSQETLKAVKEAGEAGIYVLLASSRPPEGMRRYVEELGLVGPHLFVSCQGAFVGQIATDGSMDPLKLAEIPLEEALSASAIAKARGISTNWYSARQWYVDFMTPAVAREASVVAFDPHVVPSLDGIAAPIKLLFISEDLEALAEIKRSVPEGLDAVMSNPTYLEVTYKGVDKAMGIRTVAEMRNFTMDDCVALGDGHNDLGMFAAVGASIAPSNARDEVLAQADYVTSSNDNDGVARTLRWLGTLPIRP